MTQIDQLIQYFELESNQINVKNMINNLYLNLKKFWFEGIYNEKRHVTEIFTALFHKNSETSKIGMNIH